MTEYKKNSALDPDTERAARLFLARVSEHYSITGAVLFGSRARREQHLESDADIAVLMQGTPGPRMEAAMKMADIAFDLLLETGILVEAIPLWQDEWEHPEHFNNPALIENIRHDGVRL